MSFCSYCGSKISDNVKFCPNCGAQVIKLTLESQIGKAPAAPDPFAARPNDDSFDPGKEEQVEEASFENVEEQPYEERPQNINLPAKRKSKIVAGLLGIFFGGIGLHKFYLGYKRAGLIMLLVTVVCAFVDLRFASRIVGIVGFVEGIMYMIKSDEVFYATYIAGFREWF